MTLILVGCNGTSEYRSTLRYLDNLNQYVIEISNSPDIYVDNINKIISFEHSEINIATKILHQEGNRLYGFIKTGSTWNRYRINDKFGVISQESYLSEMTEICRGNWTEKNILLQVCAEQVIVSNLPRELKTIIEEIIPDDENSVSVDIELHFNSRDGYISYARYGFQRVLNEYRLEHPNKLFATEIAFTYNFTISFELSLPFVFTEKEETLSFEEYMNKH